MRSVIALSVLATGCSVLDRIELGGPQRLDPNRVYLASHERITIFNRRELDRYACLSGPLQCELWGTSWDCSCE